LLVNGLLRARDTLCQRKKILFIAIPIALSAFTHLWNPIGFPALHGDEGHYMVKALSTLEGSGLQPQDRYAAPYFGQLFLAGIFKIIGYPDSMNLVEGDVHSIERVWLIPRVLMGLLAVVDTFLIYRITETRYNRNVAFVASVLFAVMPLSWPVRTLFLESIQTPFLLMSILLAVYFRCPLVNKGSKNSSSIYAGNGNNKKGNKKNNTSLILLSGIFLGLAIFTKIPVFTMIPLVGFLIYTNSNRNLKNLGLWFIPIISIPLIWPAHAMLAGELDKWFEGIIWQTTGRGDKPLGDALISFYKTDPVLLTLSVAGLLFTAIVKKDYIPILGTIPFLVLLHLLGYASPFHFIPIMPLLCIAAAALIVDVLDKISNNKKIIQKTLPVIVVSGIGAFGLITTSLSISKNLTSSELAASTFISQQLPNSQDGICQYVICQREVTLVGNPIYLWLPKYIFDKDYEQSTYYSSKQIETEKFILIEDNGFNRQMSGDDRKAQVLKEMYGKSTLMASFYDDKEKSKGRIDIRSN
jgi:Dolichyl-phosphate-mannose-protein mannosyltransferase